MPRDFRQPTRLMHSAFSKVGGIGERRPGLTVTWQAPKVGEVTTWQAGGLPSAGLTCEAAAIAAEERVDIRVPALKAVS